MPDKELPDPSELEEIFASIDPTPVRMAHDYLALYAALARGNASPAEISRGGRLRGASRDELEHA